MSLEDFLVQRARVSSGTHKRVKMDDKMSFFQQLASLIGAGVPLLQSLQMCAQQCQSDRLRMVLEEVSSRVAGGCSLHAALSAHLNIFEDHWVALIGTGEVSGTLEEVLGNLNTQILDSQATRRKITGAMVYPVVLVIVANLVVTIMLWFVVPTFAEMFAEMGAELPSITLFVIGASDFVVANGLYLIAGTVITVVMFKRYMQTDPGRRRVGAILLAAPMFGELSVQSAMYRFSSNLALLLNNGVHMLDALSAMAAVFRTHPVYRDAIINARHRVAAGRPLADSLDETGLFTPMMTNTVRIGEESAQLGNVMNRIAPYYKEKMNSFLSTVTKLLEPTIIVIMGFSIAVVMLAIYIPMFEMSGKVN